MALKAFLRAAFALPPNIAALVALIGAGATAPFFVAVLMVVTLAVVFVIVGPRVQRSKAVWALLCPPRPSSKVTMLSNRAAWPTPTIVVAHFVRPSSRVLDFISLNGPALPPNAIFCVPPSRVFDFPVSRITLYMLGGILPYSRNVLLKLLSLRQKAPIVVACNDKVKVDGKALTLSLSSKGVFAAALKSGAALVPCIVTADDVAHFGEPVQAQGPEPTPTADDVLSVAGAYGAALETLYKKHSVDSSTLVVLK